MLTLLFFFFNDTATTEIYTLSLHDALPIFCRDHGAQYRRHVLRIWVCGSGHGRERPRYQRRRLGGGNRHPRRGDRKSTRLNSSHANISYAVFCLKKKYIYNDPCTTHDSTAM